MKNLFISREYTNPSLNNNCTEFEVNTWLISEFILKKIIPVVGIRPYPLDELILMVSAVCGLNPTHIFEWGTHVGKSARIFYETIKCFNITAKIYSVDLPTNVKHEEHPKNNRGIMVKGLKEVKLYQGDGLDKSIEIYKKIRRSRDRITTLFFLDGDHEYESVKRELEGIIKNVKKPNILIHDTFYQSKKSAYNIGPYKAAQEVISKSPKLFKIINCNLGLPGMTLLYNL